MRTTYSNICFLSLSFNTESSSLESGGSTTVTSPSTTRTDSLTNSIVMQHSGSRSCSSISTGISGNTRGEDNTVTSVYNGSIKVPNVLNTSELVMDDVMKDSEEVGDTDSVASADELIDLTEATYESFKAKLSVLVKEDDDGEEAMSNRDENWIMKKGVEGRNIKLPPSDWVTPAPNTIAGEPKFEDIDNPGKWPSFTFRAKYDKKKAYKYHALPTGATPVPKNTDGNRIMDGWHFHYNGCTSSELTSRSGATSTNLFPDERKGRLDYDLLKKMGLTKTRLLQNDALFFKQLLHPMCDPARSGINNDPRNAYYTKIEMWSAKYAAMIGMSGSYGHEYATATVEELVRWDNIITKAGCRGRSTSGDIYRKWDANDDMFDGDIANAMNHSRWLQIKRCIKLCDNDAAKKKGEEGYNPAYKYDYAWKALIHNINAFTYEAELDLCGDETTAGHNAFGETGTGLCSHIRNKPRVTKGNLLYLLCHRQNITNDFTNTIILILLQVCKLL